MNNFKLRGVVVPLVTPLTQSDSIDTSAVDTSAVECLVNFHIERGVAGFFPAGTTGEGFLLSLDERRHLAEAVVDATAGRIPVIVHAGTPTTADTVSLAQHAQGIGASAIAVIPPYVYSHKGETLLRHFVTVAQSVPDLPVYLYNFPGISNNTLSTDLVLAMMQEAPNIIGMKDSSGSLETLTQLIAATDGAFNAINGGDGQVLAALAQGADGCVSGNANVVPELLVGLYKAVQAGDLSKARALQQTLNRVRALLGDGSNLSLFKQILTRRGVPVGDVRAPLTSAPADLVTEKWTQLTQLEIFS